MTVKPEEKPFILFSTMCAILGTTPEELRGKSRVRVNAQLRQIIIYYLSHKTTLTTTEIGELLNRDHSTIIHNRDVFGNYLNTEPHTAKHYHTVEPMFDVAYENVYCIVRPTNVYKLKEAV